MSIASEFHALHLWIDRLIGHGVPPEVIAEGKAIVGAALPAVEEVANPVIEKEIQAEAPALAPVAEALVQTGEAVAATALAP